MENLFLILPHHYVVMTQSWRHQKRR